MLLGLTLSWKEWRYHISSHLKTSFMASKQSLNCGIDPKNYLPLKNVDLGANCKLQADCTQRQKYASIIWIIKKKRKFINFCQYHHLHIQHRLLRLWVDILFLDLLSLITILGCFLKINGEKRNSEDFDKLMDKATKCLKRIFELAPTKKRNYVLDQVRTAALFFNINYIHWIFFPLTLKHISQYTHQMLNL